MHMGESGARCCSRCSTSLSAATRSSVSMHLVIEHAAAGQAGQRLRTPVGAGASNAQVDLQGKDSFM